MFKRLIRPTFNVPDSTEGRLFFRLLSFFLNRDTFDLKWQFREGKDKGRAVYITERARKGEKHGR